MICTKCGKDLPIEDFKMTKNRGKPYRMKQCKECLIDYKHQHYLKDKEKYKARAKARVEKDPEGHKKYLRDKWHGDLDENRRKARERATSERGRELNRLRSRKYRANTEGDFKDKVRSEVYQAVKSGKLIRPDKCSKCGCDCKPEAHHEDYTKSLEVTWLCKDCHEKIHHSNEGQAS